LSEESARARSLFLNTTNHCAAFADFAAFIATRTTDVRIFLSDLQVTMIGDDLDSPGTGQYYIGRTPGASGDSGFKPELRDNSPQAEHATAALFHRRFADSREAFARTVGAPGGLLTDADKRLYTLALAINAAMSSGVGAVAGAIRSELCQ
jgi:hypothetical protein